MSLKFVIFFGCFIDVLLKSKLLETVKCVLKMEVVIFFFAQKHRVKYLRIQRYCYGGICLQGFYKIQLLFEGFPRMMNSKANGS